MSANYSTRRRGLLLAFATACVSGLAVFLNGYALKHAHTTPLAYTTMKNVTAAVLLSGFALASMHPRRVGTLTIRRTRRLDAMDWLALGFVGTVGGGFAFALFFQGLARTPVTSAAFLQKTLVVWVIVLAVPLLGERLGRLQWLAIAFLVAGDFLLGGGPRGLRADGGQDLVLGATLLWAIEVVVAKRLLTNLSSFTVGLVRMGVGSVVLLVWLAVSGQIAVFVDHGWAAWSWILLTGTLLATYVGLWFAALARAPAVDVTAVLVLGAPITVLLTTTVQGGPVPSIGSIALVVLGVGLMTAWRPSGRNLREAGGT